MPVQAKRGLIYIDQVPEALEALMVAVLPIPQAQRGRMGNQHVEALVLP